MKLLVISCVFLSACTSKYQQDLGGDPERVLSRTYVADFDVTWASVLDALKSFPLDITNREGGFVQTKWVENTSERNLVESFGPGVAYLKAQFRYKISVAKTRVPASDWQGDDEMESASRVSVQRSQLVQRDVLEGWKPVSSDEIEEKTLLYRIGRLIYIKRRLQEIEDARTQKAVEASPLLKSQ